MAPPSLPLELIHSVVDIIGSDYDSEHEETSNLAVDTLRNCALTHGDFRRRVLFWTYATVLLHKESRVIGLSLIMQRNQDISRCITSLDVSVTESSFLFHRRLFTENVAYSEALTSILAQTINLQVLKVEVNENPYTDPVQFRQFPSTLRAVFIQRFQTLTRLYLWRICGAPFNNIVQLKSLNRLHIESPRCYKEREDHAHECIEICSAPSLLKLEYLVIDCQRVLDHIVKTSTSPNPLLYLRVTDCTIGTLAPMLLGAQSTIQSVFFDGMDDVMPVTTPLPVFDVLRSIRFKLFWNDNLDEALGSLISIIKNSTPALCYLTVTLGMNDAELAVNLPCWRQIDDILSSAEHEPFELFFLTVYQPGVVLHNSLKDDMLCQLPRLEELEKISVRVNRPKEILMT